MPRVIRWGLLAAVMLAMTIALLCLERQLSRDLQSTYPSSSHRGSHLT